MKIYNILSSAKPGNFFLLYAAHNDYKIVDGCTWLTAHLTGKWVRIGHVFPDNANEPFSNDICLKN
jgi:hypothetical protein